MPYQGIEQQLPSRVRYPGISHRHGIAPHLLRQIFQADLPALADRAGIAQHLPQLTQIPRPAVHQQRLQRIVVQHHFNAASLGLFCQQQMNQPQPILPLAQRRQLEAGIGQAEIQILTKTPFTHHGGQVAMSRTDHLDIHTFAPRSPQRRHFAFGQHAQQAGLQVQRHVADFVEEQGAAIGLLQQPLHTFARRTGKRPGDITEQFALDQALGNGGTVQGDERPVTALALLMQLAGENFLAGPGLALHQHGQVAILDPCGQPKVLLDACILCLLQGLHPTPPLRRADPPVQPAPPWQALGRSLVGAAQLAHV